MSGKHVKIFIAFFAIFFGLNIFAASPSQPILPSDNIQDPGDVSTPWGGCTPSDANCYVTLTSFSNETVEGLDYSTTTGILSLTAGYTIPLVASTTAWNNALAASANAALQNGNSFGTTLTLGTNDNQSLAFKTNGAVAITILGNGNVGIGTTNPNYALSLAVTGAVIGIADQLQYDAPGGALTITGGTGTSGGNAGGDLILKGGNSYTGSPDAAGDVKIYGGINNFAAPIYGGAIRLYTSDTERFSITKDGDINITGALTLGTALADGQFIKSGDWTGLFDGQEGSYYLNRSNQTGTQLASTILDFSTSTRSLLSSSATGLSYSTTTGIFSLTSGYSIPLTASTTEWANKVSSQWTTLSSNIYYTAGNVGIGTTSPTSKLEIVTSGVADNLALNTVFGGIPGISISIASAVKGYWAVAATPTNFFTDSLLGDMIFRSESNNILFGRGSGASTMAIVGSSVGIGTTTPIAKLAITGTAGAGDIFSIASSTNANILTVAANGNVGIGTSTPGSPLVVFGNKNSTVSTVIQNINSGSSAVASFIARSATGYFEAGKTNSSYGGYKIFSANDGIFYNSIGDIAFLNDAATGKIKFAAGAGSTAQMVIDASGNVGIGTTTPAYKLDVYGSNSGNFMTGITNTSASNFSGGLLTLFPNIASTNSNAIFYGGKSLSTNNGFGINYNHISDGSTSNYASFNFYGTNNILTLNAAGNVGIGTTTPTEALSIAGNINLTGALKINGNAGTSGFILQTTGTGAQWVATSSLGISQDLNGLTSAVSVGSGNVNTAATSTVFGVRNSALATNSVLMGQYNFSSTTSAGSLAIGILNNSTGASINTSTGAITGAAVATSTIGIVSTALGISNAAKGDRSTAVGLQNYITGANSSAFGYSNVATGNSNFAGGYANSTAQNYSTAIGYTNTSSGNLSQTFGYQNTASGLQSIAVGLNGTAAGDYSAVFGVNNNVSSSGATNAGIFGYTNTVSASGAYAIGSNITNSTANSLMIGPSNTAKLTILTSGNLGIGTTTPGVKVDITSADNTASTNILRVLAANGSLGVATWYSGMRAVGSSANAGLYLDGQGTGELILNQTGTGNINAYRRVQGQQGLILGTGTDYPNVLLNMSGTFDVGASGSAYGVYSGNLTLGPTNGASAYFQYFGGTVLTPTGESIPTGVGAYIQPILKSGSGSLGTTYGVYQASGSGGSSNYGAYFADAVGIGSATPLDKLQVVGDVRLGTSGSNGCIKDFAGTGIAGTCSSDERLKTNIVDLSDNYLDRMEKLRVISYQWNDTAKDVNKVDTSAVNYGLLAQNVEENFPELVTIDANGYKQVNYSRIPLYLIRAIQDLSKKVDSIMAWFKDGKLNIQDSVCVDDYCVTKAQFKQILINGQNGQVINQPTYTPPAPVVIPDPEPAPEPTVEPTPEPAPEPVAELPAPAPIE